MSSRFISSGAIDAKTGEQVPLPAAAPSNASSSTTATRSLYDVLQANKAAKQAAFEEANRLKHQFRALDEDEIGFLDEVVQRKR
ncbi:hypothetical protein M406DRAFT_244207, partial [Cryphonectria parasitica EP155]